MYIFHDGSKNTIEYFAEQNFKEFVAIMHDLLLNQGISFDAIIGAGNSGLAMAAFARLIYKELGLISPPIVPIVVFREGNRVTNIIKRVYISSIDEIKTYLPPQFSTGHILIVDDEIGAGRVAEAVMKLLDSIIEPALKFTIIAEDHGYQPNPYKAVRFLAFGKKRQGYYGVIFHVLPTATMEEIKAVIGPQEDDIKYATNLLLGLPTKEFVNGCWRFVHRYDKIVYKSILEFDQFKKSYIEKLRALIKEAIATL